MGKFYTANDEFKNYLTQELGLTFHDREAEGVVGDINYYTDHETGNQVKIDTKSNLITLLDENGQVVDESSSYTNNQIINFINK